MLGDQFHLAVDDLGVRDYTTCSDFPPSHHHHLTRRTMPSTCFDSHNPHHNHLSLQPQHQQQSHHHQPLHPHQVSLAPSVVAEDSLLSPVAAYQNGRAIRYYPPLMESPYASLNNAYSNLNQKRESVITFSSNTNHNDASLTSNSSSSSPPTTTSSITTITSSHSSLKHSYIDSLDLHDDKPPTVKSKFKSSNQVSIDGTPFTIDQIVCICQVLQKSDLHKLEKFIYNLPVDSKLAKNELILRARALAAYHSCNYKEVYDILENNTFGVKYHQELQNLWNNAHYKEHELKRGHPPGAVEKYRIRKKFQFPRTIWDGEEYVYCFKEKNRRILKEFYQKCNLPTQEDKLKLSSQTQLTVVQISNWFKNRRQRDRQPNHQEHDKTSSDAHSNVTNSSMTPSPPIPMTSRPQSNSFPVDSVPVHHPHHQSTVSPTGPDSGNDFCLLSHPQATNVHRPYYFLPQ